MEKYSNMSKRFLTVEQAVAYLETPSDSDLSHTDICQLPPDVQGNITEEIDILENDLLEPIVPTDVCRTIGILSQNTDELFSKNPAKNESSIQWPMKR